jgi:glycosyltransferase involved in cell wall biosynthesis
MTRATIVVPTHRHAATLPHAVRSALAQTVAALEVFVVGDGVDDATRAAALGLAREDARVRFFDFPKGPRHGEIHRRAALAEASAEVVCYLADDDLYYPDHVETTLAVLGSGADFAHALPIFVAADGSVFAIPGTPSVASFRDRMLRERRNVVPLLSGELAELRGSLLFRLRTRALSSPLRPAVVALARLARSVL